jgi:uncharacterized protein (UPF0548 family)
MLGFLTPTAAALRRLCERSAAATFNYPAVGSTRSLSQGRFTPPAGFDFDRRRTRLGSGDELFEAASRAVLYGRMFPTAWFRIAFPEGPVQVGDVVAIAARSLGVWWSNAARVVYVVDEADAAARRSGFGYGTLPAHVERGEERFVVEQRADGSVWFDLAAFSQPRHWAARLGYVWVRGQQARFGRDSARALRAAVAEVAGCASARDLQAENV